MRGVRNMVVIIPIMLNERVSHQKHD